MLITMGTVIEIYLNYEYLHMNAYTGQMFVLFLMVVIFTMLRSL